MEKTRGWEKQGDEIGIKFLKWEERQSGESRSGKVTLGMRWTDIFLGICASGDASVLSGLFCIHRGSDEFKNFLDAKMFLKMQLCNEIG